MIIKSVRVPSRQGIKRLVQHLYQGDENESIRLVQGTPDDIADMQADARERGRTYSVRHWIVSPREATREAQFRLALDLLGAEFGFEVGRAVVVEHAKPRATPESFGTHWHILVGEVDPVSGRVLGSSHDYARHELVARLFELRNGHEVIPGPNTAAVVAEMRRRGLASEAEIVEGASKGIRPPGREAFTHAQHQEAKRNAVDLPALRAVVRSLWEATANRAEFESALAGSGLRIAVGTRANTWIIQAMDGTLVGAVDRLVGVRKRAVGERLDVTALRPVFASPAIPSEPTDAERQAAARNAVEAELSKIEQEARIQFARAVEGKEIPDHRARLKTVETATADRLQRTTQARQEIEELYGEHLARGPRWWWLPIYRARWRATLTALDSQLEAADEAVRAAQSSIAAAKLNVLREERRVKEARVADNAQRAELQRDAQARLCIVEDARNLLNRDPSIARRGIEAVLKIAETWSADEQKDDTVVLRR